MILKSTADTQFLKTLENWLTTETEILLLFRYSHAGGNKSFEFFATFAALSDRLHQLPPKSYVTAFRRPQLPLRNVVDDAFIDQCLSVIQDGQEVLVVETVSRSAGRHSWFHNEAGETHEELRETLEDSRGSPVAVGEYPPWLDELPDVLSGCVPDEDGVVRIGAY
jgi:hypothetical protein